MPRSDADEVLAEDQAQRIRDIESRYTEVASQLAAQTVQIDGLGKAIETGMATLSEKMDAVVAPLKVVSNAVDAHTLQLKELQESEDARNAVKQERTKALKKWIVAAGLAGGGILGEKGGSWLWIHWLSQIFQ